MQRAEQLTKLRRFAQTYGWQRALTKAIGRTRPPWLRNPFVKRHTKSVSLIGCGQFAFSTICYFLQKHRGNVFLDAFDTDATQANSLSRHYGFEAAVARPDEVFANPALRLLYVVSNHASHTPYAIEGLKRGLDVYVEKPVAVSYGQFVQLSATLRQTTGRLFAGYNRPYSAAISLLRQEVDQRPQTGGMSLSYFINGHCIAPEHWYRGPEEGTRVCGNLGHWIDLTVHIWDWRSLPTTIAVQIAYANPAEPDDNLCVTLTTNQHDVVSMMLTARTEPFEGISESINLQFGDLIARIDDFTSLTVWRGSQRIRQRFRPKDVGHERAILQPYRPDNRAWSEVSLSTLLMLHIKDMVVNHQTASHLNVPDLLRQFDTDCQQALHSPVFTYPL